MATKQMSTKKKLAIAGGSLFLIAGVAMGGALVTANSTIFDNVFKTDAQEVDPTDGGIIVHGDAMSHTFSAVVDGESTVGYYTVENTSSSDFDVTLGSRVQPVGNKHQELSENLHTTITVDPLGTVANGTLAQMNDSGATTFTVPAGTSKKVRVDVFVDDAAAFQAKGLKNAETTVDYLFNSIKR